MRVSENKDNQEEVTIGFAEWLWPVPNDIKALYFVLTSVLIIIVLSWRAWYEVFVEGDRQVGLGAVAIEIISFSPAAGFICMFMMSIAVAGGMTVFGKSMYRQGAVAGEARGLSKAASWYQRKTDAEARGEPFNEPPPWEHNGSSPLDYEPKSRP